MNGVGHGGLGCTPVVLLLYGGHPIPVALALWGMIYLQAGEDCPVLPRPPCSLPWQQHISAPRTVHEKQTLDVVGVSWKFVVRCRDIAALMRHADGMIC